MMIKELVLSTKFKPLSQYNLNEFNNLAKEGVTFYALPSANLINQAKKLLLIDEKSALVKSNVLSIERLAEIILDKELIWSQISEDQSLALVSKVILDLAKKNKLVWFSQLDSYVDSIDAISNIIYDLKKGGADESIEISESMADREKDIALIYNTYQKYLIAQKLIDREEVLNQAIKILNEKELTLGESLIIYGYEFSLLQQRFIDKLEKCFKRIIIYFHYDYENNELFKDNHKVLSKFRNSGYKVRKMSWDKTNVSDYLFRNEEKVFDNIAVSGYFTKSLEVQNVLRKIKELIIQGESPTEIAISSYNLNDYQNLLSFFANQFQLPLDPINTSLDKEIFIKKLLLPLNLKRLDFPREFFLEFLRMPLNWPDFFDSKLVAKFVTLSPFDNSLNNWQQACYTQQKIKDEEMVFDHESLNTIYQSLLYIKNLFNKFPQYGNFSDMVSSFLEIFNSVKLEDYISEQLLKLDDSNSEKLFSLWQSFNLFVYQENEFDLWPDNMSFNEFYEIFKRSLAKSLSNKETLIDQTIDVLNPYQIAGLSKKYVFLLGANEGVIPASSTSWIRGIEVDELSNLPLSLNHNELLFQKGLFLRLIDTAKDELFISYILENFKGEKYYLSPFVVDILQMTNLDSEVDGRIWPEISKVAYKAELQQVLANKKAIDKLDESVKSNYYIEKLRSEATASVYNGILKADDIKESLKVKFSDYFKFSTSMLDEYGKCPFAFMMNRVLHLEEFEEFEIGITPLKRGLVLHDVLAKFLSNYLDKTLKESERDKYFIEISAILNNELENVVNTSAISTQWVELERKRFSYILKEWLDQEIELQTKTSFRPLNLEQRFENQLVHNSQKLNYTGFIDRIDKFGNKFIIYDYKTGYPPKMEDITEGVAFQLPLYIKASYDLTGLEASCGGGYYQLSSNFSRSRGMWKEECLSDIGLSRRIKDYLKKESWNELIDQTIERTFDYRELMRQGYYPLEPKVDNICSYCSYKDICRLTTKLATRLEEANEVY